MMDCSVVIPVYNSEESLPELIGRLANTLPTWAQKYEVILVNDGSRDHSWERILSLIEENSWVVGIDLLRNYGQHNALICGIRAAQYEVIVTMDDDLQHPPEEIGKLLSRLNDGYDVVYGIPVHEQHGLWRDLASQVTKIVLQGVMGAEVARKVSSFRAFRREVRDAFNSYNGSFFAIDVLLTWGAARFEGVPVRHDPRKSGESGYSFRKLVTHALNLMTGFSTLPLQFASLVGFTFTLFGMIVLIYVIGRFIIQGSVVESFPFLASIIAIFSGAQLFALGIIGEYLARMHFRLMDHPIYAIRHVVKSKIKNRR